MFSNVQGKVKKWSVYNIIVSHADLGQKWRPSLEKKKSLSRDDCPRKHKQF